MRQSRFFAFFGTVATIIVLIVLGFFVPVCRHSIYVCEVTGSERHRTTWFGTLGYETYLESPLEKYVRLKRPNIVEHRWVWTGAAEETSFGRTIVWEDSFLYLAHSVSHFVRSAIFRDLPDKMKMQIYYTLRYCSKELRASEKANVYEALSNVADEGDVRRIIRQTLPDGGQGASDSDRSENDAIRKPKD